MRSKPRQAAAWMVGLAALLAWYAPSQALTMQFDYRYDNGFFTDANAFPHAQKARAVLEHAGKSFTMYRDSLAGVEPAGSSVWKAKLFNPGDPWAEPIEEPNLLVPADTVIVYVGAADLGGSLGVGGPGWYWAKGAEEWLDTVEYRGQAGAAASNPTDFGPWGGSITFNAAAEWSYDIYSPPAGGENDFLSVATHELAHLLGFGTAPSFAGLVDANADEFHGLAAMSIFGGPVPLNEDPSGGNGHWYPGTEGTNGGRAQEAAMDPNLLVGSRKLLTDLDVAGMIDLGWEMPEAGDADRDGDVDPLDYLVVKAGLGGPGAWTDGDFDFDQDVDEDDLALLAARFDGVTGSAQPMSVPEPAGLSILAVAAGVCLSLRERRGG